MLSGERNHIDMSHRKFYLEWMFIVLFLCIYLFVAYGVDTSISRRNQTNIVFMLVGLVNILSANVLSKLYNYSVPEFLSFLKTTPSRTRLFGLFCICLSLLRFIF